MEGWMVLRRWLSRPLSLSCLLHLGGILLLSYWLSFPPAFPEERPEAEVVMDTSQEETLSDEDSVPEEAPAPDASGRPADEPAPLLSAMAASLVGQPQDTAAQAAVMSAPDPRSASQQDAPAVAADGAAAVRETGIPAAAAKGHRKAGASDGGKGDTVGQGDAASGSRGAAVGAGASSTAAGNGNGASGRGADSSGRSESTADIAARFAARVEAHKEYPYNAVKRRQQGAVTTSVTLSADGSLLSASVIGSSGVSSLDESALSAVRASCPFAHGAGHSITLEVTTCFNLQE